MKNAALLACLFVLFHYFWRSHSPELSRTKCSLSTSLFYFMNKVNQLRSLLYNLKIVLLDGNYKSNKEKDCFPSCLSYANSLMLALHHLAWAIGLALPVLLALNRTKNSFRHTQHFLCKLQLILDPNWVNQIGLGKVKERLSRPSEAEP